VRQQGSVEKIVSEHEKSRNDSRTFSLEGYVRDVPIGFRSQTPYWKLGKAWRKLRGKARLKGLRFHDLRHHAVTELAESGASEQTILAIAGQASRRMLERYSHIRLEAKRNALEALSNKSGNGTKYVTKNAFHR
jgi:integrase